jgi:hypothetical protein
MLRIFFTVDVSKTYNWIINPLKQEARFYRLNANRAYILQEVEDHYTTSHLPDLQFGIPILWQIKLPGTITVAKQVEEMLRE